MEHRALGRSGVEVSRIILGCGNFGGLGSSPAHFGAGETEGEAHALMDAAWEAGITTFDTADAYGGGRSESFIGSWLRTKGADVRDRIVLTTKTFNPMSDGADHGLSPERIRRQLDGSLERLGVESVPLYLAHAMDPAVPVAETIGAFDALVAEGKIRAYGGSNVDVAWLEEALRRGPAGLGAERVLAARPRGRGGRARGVHPRRARLHPVQPARRRLAHGQVQARRGAAGGLADDAQTGAVPPPAGRIASSTHSRPSRRRRQTRGTTPTTLAFAWLLAHPHVTAVVVGPRRPAQLRPALDALELDLSPPGA